jgi:2-polyprenyl-6-methoxyphenol hydroxylase-like FAD-dependent oxidoreductase
VDEADVLVVGAGPTGLTLACALRTHGIGVRVVDMAAGPATTSRANLLHARGVEVLDRLDAIGDLPQDARTALTITSYVGGTPAGRLRFGDAGTGTARPALLISQVMVESRLRERLAELGGELTWATEATALQQDADGVTVTVAGGTRLRARWVVGCDGAHSSVRKLAGIGFPGAPVADRFLIGDVHMSWTPDREGTHGWQHPDGMVAAMPMPEPDHPDGRDDLWRLMVYLSGETDGEPDDEQILHRLREIVPHRTGLGAVIHDAVWLSHFRIHRRLADTYRSGRVLLAGDAAHVHSPFGGQGMLTGIGDAENLAWKLALVARGAAAEPLLDTYQAERRPLAAGILRSTSSVTRLQTSNAPVLRLLRDRVLGPLFASGVVQRRATAVASQLWVTYRRGPLADPGPLGRRPRPGDRVPDLPVRLADGNTSRLHGELSGRWALIARTVPPTAAVPARLGAVAALTSVEPRDREVWLVRPDAHLAWRGPSGSPDLERWLTAALQRGRVR